MRRAKRHRHRNSPGRFQRERCHALQDRRTRVRESGLWRRTNLRSQEHIKASTSYSVKSLGGCALARVIEPVPRSHLPQEHPFQEGTACFRLEMNSCDEREHSLLVAKRPEVAFGSDK